jgi:hypothetical protein
MNYTIIPEPEASALSRLWRTAPAKRAALYERLKHRFGARRADSHDDS